MRVSLVLAACAVFAAAAEGQLPEALERALETRPVERDAARVEMRMGVGDAEIHYVVVDTPGAPQAFTLLAPAEGALNEAQAELWADVTAPDEEDDDGLGAESYDPLALRAMIGDEARLVSEADGVLTYAFTPRALPDDEPDAEPDPIEAELVRNLSGLIGVDPRRNQVRSVRLSLTDSFKPNFAARIETFEMAQDFIHDDELAGPRLSSLHFALSGSAMFQSFSESMTIEIVDVEWAAVDTSGARIGAASESP